METEVASSTSDRRRHRTEVSARLGREALGGSWRVQVVSVLARLAVIAVAVLICDAVVPGFHADLPLGPITFALVLGAVALVMQPVMVAGAVLMGWLGVLVLAFVGQALVVMVGAALLPHVSVDGFGSALLVAIVVGLVSTIASWFSTAGTSGAMVGGLVAQGRRHPADVPDPGVDGFASALLVAIVVGLVGTIASWFSTAGTSGAMVGGLVAQGRRHPAHVPDPDVDGVVFVQLDGCLLYTSPSPRD